MHNIEMKEELFDFSTRNRRDGSQCSVFHGHRGLQVIPLPKFEFKG